MRIHLGLVIMFYGFQRKQMKRLGSLGGIIVYIKVNASYSGSFLDNSNSLQVPRKFIKNVQMDMVVTFLNVIIVIFD